MSFAGDVKRELCRLPINRPCCALAELYGVLLYCNTFAAREIRLVTESEVFAQRLPLLMKKALQISIELPAAGEGKQVFQFHEPELLCRIHEAFGAERHVLAHHINFAVLEESCCRAAFFRGAFLAGGSVTDPRKGYHLELATSHFHVSREVPALMAELGFESKQTRRKSNYICYFKQSGAIEDFLTTIGAPLAAMEVMNAKLEKSLRGGVNRRVNCDAANLDKVVEAAQSQISAIRRLERSGQMEQLPEKLRQTARLRLAFPEDTLSQLAEKYDPPITKSALNHRLRKLVELGAEKEP